MQLINRKSLAAWMPTIALFAPACGDDPEPQAEIIRPVKVITVSAGDPFTVGQSIDLSISVVLGPASANAGATINVDSTVDNTGVSDAPAFQIGIYLSADVVIDGTDTLLNSRSLAGLSRGPMCRSVTCAMRSVRWAGDRCGTGSST